MGTPVGGGGGAPATSGRRIVRSSGAGPARSARRIVRSADGIPSGVIRSPSRVDGTSSTGMLATGARAETTPAHCGHDVVGYDGSKPQEVHRPIAPATGVSPG